MLLSDGKVKNYDLSDVSQLQFTNPGLQKEMEKYLEILFSRHRRDEKQVQILASGKGKAGPLCQLRTGTAHLESLLQDRDREE